RTLPPRNEPLTGASQQRRLSKPSDSKDDPAERTVLNKVAQSIGRLGQCEGLSHDWLDSAGLKQSEGGFPSFFPSRGRLSEQREAFNCGPLPDQICEINGRFAACRIAKRGEAAAGRKRCQRLAEDLTSNGVDHDIHVVPARDTAHSTA